MKAEVDLFILFKLAASFFSSAMSKPPSHSPKVDIILVFRASQPSASKQDTRKDAAEAETEYTRLLDTIRRAGLRASGKRGQKNGQVLVFIWAPADKLARLVKRERCVITTVSIHT